MNRQETFWEEIDRLYAEYSTGKSNMTREEVKRFYLRLRGAE